MLERWRTAQRTHGGKLRADAPWLLGLLAVAAVYYGLYFRCGFNVADEGSVALLSQRILQGERPLVDLMLGYNVLWFYPITGLFWLCGVNVLLMKGYFYALATLSAVLGYLTIRKLSGQRLYAFVVGLLLIAIPASSFRAALPLLVMANGCALVRLIWGQGWAGPALGGLVLGLTFLVRVDVGIFSAVIWLGTALLGFFVPRDPARTWVHPLVATLLIAVVAVAVHLPFYLHARARGFAPQFVQQYLTSLRVMRGGLSGGFSKPAPLSQRPVAAIMPAANPSPEEVLETASPAVEASRNTLGRKAISQIWQAKKWKVRAVALVSYAPILSLGLVLLWALVTGTAELRRRQPDAARRCLSILVLVGGALTLFPQFFGFRPDMAHLAEFMPGLVVAVAAAGYYLFEAIRSPHSEVPWQLGGCRFGLRQVGSGVICALLLSHVVVWSVVASSQSGAGTLFTLRNGRNIPFQAENGVNVLLNAAEYAGYSKIRDVIAANSKPGEYVVCYPYSPGINVLCNRPTYEWSLYVDNAVRASGFDAKTITKIKGKNPAVLVINDWAINRREDSRFSVWAKGTQEYVAANYQLAGTYYEFQIYVRRPGL